MLLLDVSIVFVALPQIQHGLHATLADVQWVADAYALSLASLLLATGVLGDMYGRRGTARRRRPPIARRIYYRLPHLRPGPVTSHAGVVESLPGDRRRHDVRH